MMKEDLKVELNKIIQSCTQLKNIEGRTQFVKLGSEFANDLDKISEKFNETVEALNNEDLSLGLDRMKEGIKALEMLSEKLSPKEDLTQVNSEVKRIVSITSIELEQLEDINKLWK